MTGKLVFTKYCDRMLTAYYEDDSLTELSLSDETSILGNIYVGKVKNIVSNINAAFVEVGNGILCYYSLTDNDTIFLNPKKNQKLTTGDEILVQIAKDGIKTKAPSASAKLNITGTYVVITREKGIVKISNKITDSEKRQYLKEIGKQYVDSEFGCIFRTNVETASEAEILEEITLLTNKLRDIVNKALFLKCGQCVYENQNSCLSMIKDYHKEILGAVVTDQPDIYKDLLEYKKENGSDVPEIIYYDPEEDYGLFERFRLHKALEDVQKKKVWLKSGAYLVIEQTEAMVVIDVNTGKAINKKKQNEHILKVNKEAAAEIARQLRLRNLSGIIMIDFINMESEADMESLVADIKKVIQYDRIHTDFVDVTKLGLVELTRKKVRKSFLEQLQEGNLKNEA